jgi:hypothetical protein
MPRFIGFKCGIFSCFWVEKGTPQYKRRFLTIFGQKTLFMLLY